LALMKFRKDRRKRQRGERREEIKAAEEAAEAGKTIINIECCMNCDEHAWNTSHDEKKYKRYYANFKLAMGELAPDTYHVGKNLEKEVPSIGAFEIFVGGKLKFSKIKRRKWPHVGFITHKIAGVEYDRSKDKNRNGIDDQLEKEGKVTDINTDGIKDTAQPEVMEKYKKEMEAKRKAQELEAKQKAMTQAKKVVSGGDDEF